MKLRSYQQKVDESFENLSLNVERLVLKAYQGVDNRSRRRIARDHYVNAVADEKIWHKLRERNPKTLKEAIR